MRLCVGCFKRKGLFKSKGSGSRPAFCRECMDAGKHNYKELYQKEGLECNGCGKVTTSPTVLGEDDMRIFYWMCLIREQCLLADQERKGKLNTQGHGQEIQA